MYIKIYIYKTLLINYVFNSKYININILVIEHIMLLILIDD